MQLETRDARGGSKSERSLGVRIKKRSGSAISTSKSTDLRWILIYQLHQKFVFRVLLRK